MRERLRIEREGAIAQVILDRPDKLNALDLASWRRLAELFRELDRDDDLRCILVRGADARAFSAGADIAAFERERADREQARIYGHAMQAAMKAIMHVRHPVVAAISGVCVGGGLELACACDLRIAARSARFGVPIKRLGLTMSYGELQPLLRLVGPAHAAEILLEGEIFSAGRAKEMGLVNRLVEDGRWLEEGLACCRRIAEGAPLVARWHKKFIRRLMDPTPLTPAEIEEGFASLDTEDYRRGVRAFLSRTEPEFLGM